MLKRVVAGILLVGILSSVSVFARGNDTIAVVEHGNKGAVYAKGEKIIWKLTSDGLHDKEAQNITFIIKQDGLHVLKRGTIDLSLSSQTITSSLDEAGTLLLQLEVANKRQVSGAVVAPEHIKASMPVPDDFKQFWKDKLALQDKVPMNAKLILEPSLDPEVESYLITLDTINTQTIQGRLAKVKGDAKMPAMLMLQYAGVYGVASKGIVRKAKKGWLCLNILAHDIPINKDKAFYTNLKKGELARYTSIGNTDRETSYFLRMLLATSRAVDYLSQHPNWDGKNIVVTGGSQGGYQALVAASLNKKVTLVEANVPAGCDQTAPMVPRALSWPYWLRGDAKNQKKIQASRYFDAVNFAHDITCPVLISFGLGDTTSRPAGIYAAINALSGKVEVVMEPDQGHTGSYRSFYRKLVPEWEERILAPK